MNYSEIRKFTPIIDFRMRCIADLVCMSVSPYFSLIFIKKRIKPNTITLLMIFSGIIGAILFSFPYIMLKIIGIVFFYLWYIMDCSDGEVARATKQFSKYGRELDYMAHLICHPLMNLSLWISYIQLNIYNPLLISLIFIVFISLELIIRNYISFETYTINDSDSNVITKGKNIFKYVIVQFCIYPNSILIFPIIYVLSSFLNFNSLIILFIFLFMFIVSALRGTCSNLRKFYYS